jgi:hypothetical protein
MLLAAATADVTAWPQRLALTSGVLAVMAASVWGMWRSWHRRAQLELPVRPVPEPYAAQLSVGGRYLGTAPAEDWMRRVVAAGLGAPGNATASVGPSGVLLTRVGEPDAYIAADQITDVRLGRGVAGQVAEADGVVIWDWAAGQTHLQTGFRPDSAEHVVDLYTASRAHFAGEESR